jgi:hypothetical protein
MKNNARREERLSRNEGDLLFLAARFASISQQWNRSSKSDQQ